MVAGIVPSGRKMNLKRQKQRLYGLTCQLTTFMAIDTAATVVIWKSKKAITVGSDLLREVEGPDEGRSMRKGRDKNEDGEDVDLGDFGLVNEGDYRWPSS